MRSSLSQNPAAPELNAFDHVIVDEYQDLNTLEQHLLDVLTERADASLCVAGDDDQSIYSMRYAHPEGIKAFLIREGTVSYEIWKCGRCPQRVLSMANSLIRRAPDRNKPDLEGIHADEGTVAIVQWADLDEEINGVVTAITSDISSHRREPGDILVLTHRRFIGERIREGLHGSGIAAESYFREEELSSDKAREALALLRLAVSPDDAPALRVILGVGDSDGRSVAYRKLADFARAEGSSPSSVLDRINGGEKVAIPVTALLARYQKAQGVISQLDVEDLEGVVNRLYPEGVIDVQGLRRIALEVLPECTTAGELLERIVGAVTQEDVPQRPDFVRIMSLHKSKGLTSLSVFVVGLMQGIVPTINPRLADDSVEESVAEQRRLFFVAITRAADQLTISSSLRMDMAVARLLGAKVADKTIRKEGDRITCGMIASQYLLELGPTAPRAARGIEWIAGY